MTSILRGRYGHGIIAILLAWLTFGLEPATAGATGGPSFPQMAIALQDDDDDDDDNVVIPVVPPPAESGGASQDEVVFASLDGIVDDDGDPTTDGYRSGQVIVRVEPDTDMAALTSRHGARELASIPSRNVHLLQIPQGIAEDDYADALVAADDVVAWAEPNGIDQAPEGRPTNFFLSAETGAEPPGESYHADLLGLDGLAGCAAGAGTVVAVIDTGVDASHPDLDGRVLPGGFNALDNSENTADTGNGQDDDGDGEVDEMTGHGTHVAGIIAQVAPEVEILAITGLDSDGVGDAFLLAESIYFAIDAGANVINLSLGSTRDAQVVEDAVAEAFDAGVVVAAAAGNLDRDQPVEYPAADPNVAGVAATDDQDAKSDFSNYGDTIDLAAPGTDIVSAYPGGEYASWSGTSMATPFVAATAALLLSEDSEMAVAEVLEALVSSAVSLEESDSEHADALGAGRIDVVGAAGCD